MGYGHHKVRSSAWFPVHFYGTFSPKDVLELPADDTGKARMPTVSAMGKESRQSAI